MSCAPVDSTTKSTTTPVPLLSFEADKHPDGSFSFSYEGGDQSYRKETGVVIDAGTEDEALEISGSYRYIDADGQTVEVHYTAGKNGFVPVGTIIPNEISALAKAAADLPSYSAEEEQEQRLSQRRARAQEQKQEEKQQEKQEEKQAEKQEEKQAATSEVQATKVELKAAESQVVPVQVVQVEQSKPSAETKSTESKKIAQV